MGVMGWQRLLLILCLLGVPQLVFCQSKDNIPIPEYFGIYAVVEGHLIKLDAQQVRADKNLTVRLGQRNGVGNILQGQPVASSTNAQVPEFASDLKIVVFSQTGGMQSPLDTAKSLHLERLVFVRNLTVGTGFPNNVRRTGAENGWESGDAPELLGLASGDRAKVLEFLIKPLQGHQDMVVAVLPEKLSPGLYRIRVGEANPFSGGGGLVFAVSPVSDGVTANCVDATVTYSFNISNSKYTPCGGRAQTAGTTGSQDTVDPASSSSSRCGQAVDLGYALRDGSHVYRVDGIGPFGPQRVHVFYDENGIIVQGQNHSTLLQRLALGAWTKEFIVDRYNSRNGSWQVNAFVANYVSLQGWLEAVDLLARTTVESIAAVVTGGDSVETLPTRLTLAEVQRQFASPKVALAHWVPAGLERSLADYGEMEGILQQLSRNEPELSQLERIAALYAEANTLASVHEALGAAIAPTTWQDVFTQYLNSAVSELPIKANTFLTVKDVLSLEQLVAGTGQAFVTYKQSLDLASRLYKSNQQVVSEWATAAARGCNQSVAKTGGNAAENNYPPPTSGTTVASALLGATGNKVTALSACSTATDASYKLQLDKNVYTVRKLQTPGVQESPVFFDSANQPVSDPVLARRLSVGAWTVDNVVLDAGYRLRTRSGEVASLLETAAELKKYEVVQDELVRLSVEAFAATVSDGRTLGGSLGRAVKGGVKAQVKDPKNYLLSLTSGSLVRSMQDFQSMESKMKNLDANSYDVTQLGQIETLYREGSGLLQTFRPVAVAMMPKNWTDLVDQALSSMGSQVLSVLESLPEAATPAQFVDALWSKVGIVQLAGDIQLLAQKVKFARDISAANDRMFDRWAIVTASTCGQEASTEAVLAEFMLSNENEFVLAPFLTYAQNRYVSLPDGTNNGFEARLTQNDYVKDGVDPDSPRVVAAKRQSILNKIKSFEVFRKGKRVGSFSVSRVDIIFIGAGLKAVGRGTPIGFQLQGGDIAVAGPASHAGFWSSTSLSPAQQRQVLSQALGLLPKTVPPNKGMPQLVGKPIVIGETRVSTDVLDLRREGKTEVFFDVSAEMKTSLGPFSNGYISLLQAFDPASGSWKKMLSCESISEGEIIWGDSTCSLIDVVDINGDGVAELVLERGHGEVGDIEIYDVSSPQPRLIFSIRGWTGS